MKATVHYRTSFAQVQRQLLAGARGSGIDPTRVDHAETRNLFGCEPSKAAARMRRHTLTFQATTLEMVGHLILSLPYDPKTGERTEQLAVKKWLDVAERFLEEMGLAEHGALLAHRVDLPHDQFHIVFSRVNTCTGATWNRWRDWLKLSRITDHIERDYGLSPTPWPTRKRTPR